MSQKDSILNLWYLLYDVDHLESFYVWIISAFSLFPKTLGELDMGWRQKSPRNTHFDGRQVCVQAPPPFHDARLQGNYGFHFSPSDLRVDVCDQNRVWLLAPSQVKCSVLIGADNAPFCERNMVAIAKRLKHQDHLPAIIFCHP